MFPLMFPIIFGSLYPSKHTDGIPYDDYFVPGILAYGVIATTFVNMALNTSVLRDEGVLKRISSAESAPAIVNMTILPLTFISGIWFTTTGLPKWLQDIAKVFPVRALADSLQYAFNPNTAGAGFKGSTSGRY